MQKIAIIGVGLIGGSLALCFKGVPDLRVVGYTNNQQSAEICMKRNVVDEATTSLADAVENADFIFLCVPVGLLGHYLSLLDRMPVKPGCIITDVGSTKGTISEYGKNLTRKDVVFIGGHPMAGSERSGVEAASSHLFENAFYVLTPDESVPEEAYERLVGLLRHTSAQMIRLDPELHDDIVGAVSHLPHIIAVALVNLVDDYNESNDLYKHLAAGGFRDITRIASSDPIVWRDILLNNRMVLLKLLEQWNGHMERFIRLLKHEDGEGIADQFRKAASFRQQLPERRKGMITSMYDIYVDVPDQPGIVGTIATRLGQHHINLSNLHIFESRLDVPGVLRLSFRNEEDMNRAAEVLGAMDCPIHF